MKGWTTAAAALLAACAGGGGEGDAGHDAGPDGGPPEVVVPFPEGFLWGTATAGFQVEPGCPTVIPELCEDRGSDWWVWVTDPDLVAEPGNHLSGHPPSWAPGQYELFAGDLDLARDGLANNAIRLSLEWSRLFPGPTFEADTPETVAALADPVAVAHYHEFLDAARERGLTLLVTIHHYTLPSWIHDAKGCHQSPDECAPAGWMDPETTVSEMAKYARFVAEEYGSKVDLWATLNEPLAVVMAGFLLPTADRTNPPGLALQADRAVTALFAMAEAHARVADAVRNGDLEDADGDDAPARLGIVHAVGAFAPLDPDSEADQLAAEHAFSLYNRVFLDTAISGDLDSNLDGVVDEHREDLAGRTDFVGVNYYFRTLVRGLPAPIFGSFPLLDFMPAEFITDPEGMTEALTFAAGYGLPVYVTECGVDDPAGDGIGPAFLVPHLLAVGDAVADGIDVRGFFYWSLMDNYEWNHGLDMRFGLYAVDPLDPLKERTPKLSAGTYADVAAANGVPLDLAGEWGR